MWVRYLVWFGFYLLAALECAGRLASLAIDRTAFGDYLLYIFGGMKEYIPVPGKPIQIPYLWLLGHIGVLYFTLHYMYDDLAGVGRQMILRSGSRTAWWLSKCVWNCAAVCVFYLIAWGIVALCAWMSGVRWSFAISPFMTELMDAGPKLISGSTWDIALELTLMPLLVTLAMSLFQMALCLLLRPVASYVCSVVIFLASTYYLSPLLIGNYAMALRSGKVISNGVHLLTGIGFSAALIIGSAVLGAVIFRNYDILNKGD